MHKYYYSDKLKLRFRSHIDGIIFEDRTAYTAEEIKIIREANCQDDLIRTIHLAKKVLNGIICTRSEQ